MPADYSLRFRDDEEVSPAGPEEAQADPEQPVERMEARTRLLSFEHGKLLPEGEDLDGVVAAAAEEDAQSGEGNQYELEHGILRYYHVGRSRPSASQAVDFKG